jgi:N-sulfoglucosamine sulfohydrolase
MKLFIALFLVLAPALLAKPNILWITSEDNASHWLGCYGNKDARTPRLDALAAEGMRFTAAYSNAAVCAVARSTILNGVYAPSQGTQHMRSRHPIPASIKPYVTYLREQGYYCTNNSKTDYNFKGNDAALWDDCSGKAHYRKRPDGKPFFAIFNLTETHESSLFPRKNEPAPRLDPAKLTLPPYLPDLPEVRSDFARYHDRMTDMDTRVGEILDQLEKAGLAEDTIVFYYADHGGPTPRGKRYLEDTGVRIPLILRIPEKYRALAPFKPGQAVAEPVSFVDLAPTLLSLAGQEKPDSMQGRAFLGAKRVEPAADPAVFLFADRFDELYGMRRGLTDGRWKYIRRFTPHLPAAPYSYYQFGMPSWTAIQKAWQDGKLTGIHKALWESPQPTEVLFDTQADPWEIRNLAEDPAHAGRLAAFRDRLKRTMAETFDIGLIPEPMFKRLAGSATIREYTRSPKFRLQPVLDLAFLATSNHPADLPAFIAAMSAADPVERYWAIQGCLTLGPAAAPATDALLKAIGDQEPANRIAAAHALHLAGRPAEAKAALLATLDQPLNQEATQYALNALTTVGALEAIPDAWVEKVRSNKKANEYLLRIANRLHQERQKK